MKKTLSVLAIAALVAVVSTSCKKECTCKMYLNGDKLVKIEVFDDDENNCALFEKSEEVAIGGDTYEVKCK